MRSLIESMSRRRALVCASAGVCAAALALPGVASAAESPRWAITAVSNPTVMSATAGRDQVMELDVSATEGSYEMLAGLKGRPASAVSFAWDAEASEVQAALEGVFGAGNVVVTGGPGDEKGEHPYTITFGGELSGSAPILEVNQGTSKLGCAGAVGACAGEATIATVTEGKAWGAIIVTATNVGGAPTDGGTITLADSLPANVQAIRVLGADAYRSGGVFHDEKTEGLTCSTATVSCTVKGSVDTGDQLVMTVMVKPPASGAGSLDEASVAGGGAGFASVSSPFVTGNEAVPFGPVPGSVVSALSTDQAGAHPDYTTQYTLESSVYDTAAGDVKDIRFDLPQGLVGSTVGMPRCTMGRVQETVEYPEECPADTIVGMATVTLLEEELGSQGSSSHIEPVYNIAPSPGEPAAFGFDVIATPVRLDTSVLTDGIDNVRVTAPSLAETQHSYTTSVTVWGVPREHAGRGSDESELIAAYNGTPPNGGFFGGVEPNQTPAPLMTNPQSCGAALSTTMEADSWEEPGVYRSESVQGEPITGCDLVPFSAAFSFLPDTLEAGAPAGYSFNLNVPQRNEAGVLATSSVKEVSLTLPEGVVVNPSAAWGLQACSNAQFYGPGVGPFGSNERPAQPAAEAKCPRQARIGEVEVQSPDLEQPLKGQVFLATPECDPCSPKQAEDGKMVRLFIQLVGEGESGIVVKLEGHGDINQQTGQITTVFKETPQLPFSHMSFVLEGGPRAVLANPRTCGKVTTSGVLTPWTQEEGVEGEVKPTYSFEIDQGCFGARFKPSLAAGMPNAEAGQHGEFTLAFGREDHDQMLEQISLKMPPGLLGTLTGVELCKQAQANAGTCGADSLIGEAQVLTGPGADPFLVEGGKVFLTEGYGGSQYGLSVVVPAVAGPYTLGGLSGEGKEADDGKVVVRTQLYVDPHTAQITAVSGTLPNMLDGIPLQLKAVSVKLNRPGFMFNPTNCEKMQITGTLASVEGMSANVSSPFQVTDCASLAFKPGFKVSTSAKTSRTEGASLHVTLSYPKAPQGTQANIKSVRVELPRALPSRLSTLNHACLDSVFNANPASCPAQSRVGYAKAVTPVLPVPLEGPAYFVSHGGQKFPELIMVLQGYGVTIDLAGETFISKAGVTSSTFKTVPDVPVDSFELTLPEGQFSALGANRDLCTAGLVMPTVFDAQNGARLEQKTPIEVQGCPYSLRIVHRTLHKRSLTLNVSVPAAGRLVANGKGVSIAAKNANGRQTLTLTLKERHAGKLHTRIQLRFTPKTAKQRSVLRKTITVTFS